MLKQSCFLAFCGLAVIFASPASSQTFNAAQFIGIDRDADNMISKAEAVAYRLRYFSTLDENQNGKVEFEEYVVANKLRSSTANTGAPVPVPDAYKEVDADKDTVLTTAEFQAVGDKRFTMLDTNKDGKISQAEFVKPGL